MPTARQAPKGHAEKSEEKCKGATTFYSCARAILPVRFMAEAILNHRGRAHFTAYRAGSHPLGNVRPEAIKLLLEAGLPTELKKEIDRIGQIGEAKSA